MATVIILAAVLAAAALAVWRMVKRRGAGGCACGSSCEGCASCGRHQAPGAPGAH